MNPQSDQTLLAGQTLFLANTAADPDGPAQTATDLVNRLPVWRNRAATPPFGFTNLGPSNFTPCFYPVLLGP